MQNALIVIVVAAVIIGLIIGGPLVTIWALNTLFAVGIAYNFWTWLAAVWLASIVAARKFEIKK